ncbi:MAG: cytochrome c oxidase subunit 3 [Bacteroidota bacterium]
MSQTEQALLSGKTAIWLLMLTVIILFGTLTFTFVASVSGDVQIPVPPLFYLNTFLLIASSIFMHLAMLKEDNQRAIPNLRIALVLGLTFIASQLYAWYQMVQVGLSLSSGGRVVSYLYVLSGLHGVHILGGLIFITVVVQKLRKEQTEYLEMATWFWHFLGMLWIFLLAIIALHT